MLHGKSVPWTLWAEALNFAKYIKNRSPHRYVKDKTPYKAWSGLKPEVTHFHIFGSHAWAQTPSKMRKEFDPQSIECIFVEYPDGVKGCRIIDLFLDQLIIERSFKFEESVSHVPQQLHAYTFILPPVRDGEHAHADSSLDKCYDSEGSYDSNIELVQLYAELENLDVDAEPKQRPKWA
jgi:hypothetical protein